MEKKSKFIEIVYNVEDLMNNFDFLSEKTNAEEFIEDMGEYLQDTIMLVGYDVIEKALDQYINKVTYDI